MAAKKKRRKRGTSGRKARRGSGRKRKVAKRGTSRRKKGTKKRKSSKRSRAAKAAWAKRRGGSVAKHMQESMRRGYGAVTTAADDVGDYMRKATRRGQYRLGLTKSGRAMRRKTS